MSNPITSPPRSQRDIPTWQRVLWTLLPVVSLSIASWVPFVYWANRRNYGSGDQRWWIGFAAGTVVVIILAATFGGDDNKSLSALSGGFTITLILAAAIMTWIKLAPKRM